MLHFTDPTYAILDSKSEWVGNTRYETFGTACDAAMAQAEEDGRDYYVIKIEATAHLEPQLIDIYGAVWR